jgi:hypothetical protein
MLLLGVGVLRYEIPEMFADDVERKGLPSVTTPLNVEIASSEIVTKSWSMTLVENRERDAAKRFLSLGEYDAALSAAKAYYDVVELSKTQDAVKLLTTVLRHSRGDQVASQFKKEQEPSKASELRTSTDAGQCSVLQTITLDPTVYQSQIAEFQGATDDFRSMIVCGDLCLLSDKPRDARTCFEIALQIANMEKVEKPPRTLVALEGIAKAIRDEDGSARRTDLFISLLRRMKLQGGNSPASRVQRAAIRLGTSGFFDGDPGPRCPSLEDPSMQAAGDPSLAAWLDHWEQNDFDSFYVRDSKERLLTLLQDSSLSSLTLMSIGRAISFRSTDDWIIGAFLAAAAERAHKELLMVRDQPIRKREILVALSLAKPTLWRVIDSGDRTFLASLYLLNRDLADQILTNDTKLQNAKVHGSVGAAECLWLTGKYDEALKTVAEVDKTATTIEQQRAAAWIRGLALLSLCRYAEAGSQFQFVAKAPQYVYTEPAMRWAAVCFARSGKSADANRAFDDWARRYHPDVTLAARVIELMQGEKHLDQAADDMLVLLPKNVTP